PSASHSCGLWARLADVEGRSHCGQTCRNRRRYPIGLDPQVAENHLGGVVPGKAGDVAARMTALPAQIKVRYVRAVRAGAGEWPVVANLILREGADEQVAAAHVGQAALDIERRADEAVEHRVS